MNQINCKQCGTSHLDSTACPACNYRDMPAAITLRSTATGLQLVVRTSMELGRGALAELGDPDLKYCDTRFQFRLTKSLEHKGWLLQANESAGNPTYLNLVPVPPQGVVLQAGDELSIKGKVLKLAVDF